MTQKIKMNDARMQVQLSKRDKVLGRSQESLKLESMIQDKSLIN
jgi:hypothetical protein